MKQDGLSRHPRIGATRLSRPIHANLVAKSGLRGRVGFYLGVGMSATRTIEQVKAEIQQERAKAIRYARQDPRRDDIDALVDSLVIELLSLIPKKSVPY